MEKELLGENASVLEPDPLEILPEPPVDEPILEPHQVKHKESPQLSWTFIFVCFFSWKMNVSLRFCFCLMRNWESKWANVVI